MWDYAEHSKEVAKAGGVKEYIDLIESTAKEIGRAEGQEEMGKYIKFAVIGGVAFGACISSAINWAKDNVKLTEKFPFLRKKKLELELAEAKEQFIQEYNSECSEEIEPDITE